VKKPKLIEVDGEEEWKVEKILNKQKKKGNKVLSTMEEVYIRKQHIGKRRRPKKCKESSGKFQRENWYRNQKATKSQSSRRARFQMRRVAKEIYSKDIVWVE